MGPKRMNVLVYSGTGSTVESVRHCLYSLRRLLSNNYAVLPVTGETILKEPWQGSCALLVMPGGADLGYCRTLNGAGNRSIRQYVNAGGSYLGLCAGGYYGSSRCEFEVGDDKMEVVGSRELEFFPGVARGSAFSGFVYASEEGTVAAELTVNKTSFASAGVSLPEVFRTYFNGGSVFVDAEKMANRGVEVLATYSDKLDVDPGQGAAAVIYRKVGEGHVVLTGPHPEFASANLSKSARGMKPSVFEALEKDDKLRKDFFKACVLRLGLTVNEHDDDPPSLSPIHLSSIGGDVSNVLEQWEAAATSIDGEAYIKAEVDTFHIQSPSKAWSMEKLLKTVAEIKPRTDANERAEPENEAMGNNFLDYGTVMKELVPHNEPPTAKSTPYFNHRAYYSNLQGYRKAAIDESQNDRLGHYLLYGEVVTSTSTLLEKNPKLTVALPSGTTFTATTQLSGRGRGSNVWISPAGSLMFSTLLRHPLAINATAPVVFLQYLAALAIVEGIQTYDIAGIDHVPTGDSFRRTAYRGLPVKLKWPNDIYALDPSRGATADPADPTSYVKIGGILVNTSYSGGDYTLIIGIGLNVANAAPTTSLNTLIDVLNANSGSSSGARLPPFALEKLLARILSTLNVLYAHFCAHGFVGPLEDLYYRHWLHGGQVVTLEEEGGVKARIKGITRDWGLLVAEEVREVGIGEGSEFRLVATGKSFALQSDSNSFDFFKGLVRRKL